MLTPTQLTVSRSCPTLVLCVLEDMIFVALIESGMGVLNLASIAPSIPSRLRALIFGADDLAADIGAIRTLDHSEVAVARSLVVLAAKGYGLQALDLVQINYNDPALLERDCEKGIQLGYTGKQIIHPNQIDVCHRFFAPSSERIAWAQKIVSEGEKHEKEGKGAFSIDGLMIDMPTIKNAQSVLARARACGLLS